MFLKGRHVIRPASLSSSVGQVIRFQHSVTGVVSIPSFDYTMRREDSAATATESNYGRGICVQESATVPVSR